MGIHSLLQGIFLTEGSNLGLPHGGQILHHLSHQGSHTVQLFPFTCEWTLSSGLTVEFEMALITVFLGCYFFSFSWVMIIKIAI